MANVRVLAMILFGWDIEIWSKLKIIKVVENENFIY